MKQQVWRYIGLGVTALLMVMLSDEYVAYGQNVPTAFAYQAIARDGNGQVIANKAITIKASVLNGSATGAVDYAETHTAVTNQFGLFTLQIGNGASVDGSFNSIDWSNGDKWLEIEVDPQGGSNFIDIGTTRLLSVPFALMAGASVRDTGLTTVATSTRLIGDGTSGSPLDIAGQGAATGQVLKWNGMNWVPGSDNVGGSGTGGSVITSPRLIGNGTSDSPLDIAGQGAATGQVLKWNGTAWAPAAEGGGTYVAGPGIAINGTTIAHAPHGGDVSGSVSLTVTGIQGRTVSASSPTDGQALRWNAAAGEWEPGSGGGTRYVAGNGIGITNDTIASTIWTVTGNNDVVRSLGNIGIGTTAPLARLHVAGSNGVLFTGTLDAGSLPATGAGTRLMWYPRRAAFRAGGVDAGEWDNDSLAGTRIGYYSVGLGRNTIAAGNYATATGFQTAALGVGSSALGYQTKAGGIHAVALGLLDTADGDYSIAIGHEVKSRDISGIAIGYQTEAAGQYAMSLGYQSRAGGTYSISLGLRDTADGDYSIALGYLAHADGNYSTALGSYANTNGKTGSFVYGDYSASTSVSATAQNQFVARAAGGVIFYSNAAMSSGVSLAAGGGAWSNVSDRNKKEEFRAEDGERILSLLAAVPVMSWNYRSQDRSIRHIGPTAQDFYAAFGFGESDTTITTVDIDGVNMLAIQALERRTAELRSTASDLQRLQSSYDDLETRYRALADELAQLRESVGAMASGRDSGAVVGR